MVIGLSRLPVPREVVGVINPKGMPLAWLIKNIIHNS